MGLFSFISNQFIDVISWLDDSANTLCWRFPDNDQEIKNGAKLTVREGQVAIFVSEGQLGDVFKPGLYTLTTQNIPILTSLKSWKYGFNSPFKAEVYFLNTKQYIDMKWGTMNPIMMRDQDFGIVRTRAFGVYSIRIADPLEFFRTYVGTDSKFTTDEIEGQLRKTLVSAFTNVLGQAKIPVLDLAGNYDVLASKLQEKIDAEFRKTGIALAKFIIENISLPPEVEKAIDARSSMGAVGNLAGYTQFQAATAIREAASQPGGGAGSLVGLGASVGIGQAVAHSMAGGMQAPPPPAEPSFHLSGPAGQQGPMPASAAAQVIRAANGAPVTAWMPGMAAWQPWQQVPQLAALVGPPAPPPMAPPPPPAPTGPPPLAAAPVALWHYSAGGPPEGPLTTDQVAERVSRNPAGTHKVWKEGMGAWAEPKTLPDFAGRPSRTGPPPLS